VFSRPTILAMPEKKRSGNAGNHRRWIIACNTIVVNRTVSLCATYATGFPFLAPEIVQNLLMLFSLVLFGSINNQPERD